MGEDRFGANRREERGRPDNGYSLSDAEQVDKGRLGGLGDSDENLIGSGLNFIGGHGDINAG